MDLQEMLKRRLVEKVEPDAKNAQELLDTAAGNIAAAEDNLKMRHPDWALAIAYNAMLSAGRALMASRGYRPTSESHHVAIVQFSAAMLPSGASALAAAFNRYRVRRHDVIYGEAKSVGWDEAERAIVKAGEFLEHIRRMCKK